MTTSAPVWVRLFDRTLIGDHCWEWQGRTNNNGYGNIRVDGRVIPVHRVAYEVLVGPIPHGLQIDHLCRNRRCVRPDHLEPVTCRENLLRGETITARNAAATHCPKGHPYDAQNTRRAWSDGSRVCGACRREYHKHYMRKYRANRRGYPSTSRLSRRSPYSPG